jgi:hypothetical protein
MKTYAGIGSRETPEDVCLIMKNLATKLEAFGYTLRSGGAEKADQAFASGVTKKSNMQIFLPWRGHNAIDSIYTEPSEEAMELAEAYHPAWNKMGERGKLLQGRNSHIILGENLDDPVDFVICWTQNGGVMGGTGQGMRIANSKKIPIYNLRNEADIQKLSAFLATLTEQAVKEKDAKKIWE